MVQMSPPPSVRIAILGLDHMHGWSYAHALTSGIRNAQLTAVADASESNRQRMQSEFPQVEGLYSDVRTLLEHSQIDAAIICSDNASHAAIATECFRHKIPVLCEKPIAISAEQGIQMIEEARAAEVPFMTAFPVRFCPAVRRAKRLIESGELGRIFGACTSNHGSMPGSWFVERERAGGGALIDHTVHVADILRYLLEDEVQTVTAECATRMHDLEVEDVGLLLMQFRSGVVASLDTSWSRPASFPIWGDVIINLKGEKGNLSINCFPPQLNHYDDRSLRHKGSSPGKDLDLLMVQEFVDCVAEKREPIVTGEDGLRALEVALAGYRSVQAGGTPVTLNH